MLKKYTFYFIIIISTILTSCQGKTETTSKKIQPTVISVSETPYQTPETKTEGGMLTLSMRMPHTLNPLLNEDVTVDKILKLIFEPLFILDENHKPFPNLAESYSFSPDSLTLTIKLKDNIVWSDNMPVKADDVVYSIETIIDSSESSIYKDFVNNISSYDAIDDKTVVINLYGANIGSLYNLCFPIIPKHYYDVNVNNTLSSPINMSPLGTGLYKFDEYQNLKELNFSINDNSFREKPYINKLKVIITSDKETDLYSFSQGIIDAIDSDLNLWGKYRGNKDANIDEYSSTYYEFIGFNFDNSIFQDKNMRKAIAHSISIDEIISKIYLNHAEKTRTPIGQDNWLYEPNISKYDQNLVESTNLLNQSGYADINNNYILDKNVGDVAVDINFKIIVNQENDERIKIANNLKENLKKLKIESKVVVLPFTDYETALKNGDFDLFIGGYNMSFIPDFTFAFHSKSMENKDGKNYFSYSNKELDLLLEQANLATTEEDFVQSFSEIQKYVSDDLPCISLVYKKISLLSDKKVQGDKKPLVSNIYSNINQWHISE